MTERVEGDAHFGHIIEAFRHNEELIEALTEERQRQRLSQRHLAELMETSQSVVAHIEAGDVDPRLSTVQRYAAALGKIVRWELVEGAAKLSQVEQDVSETPIVKQVVAI
jgi:predicted transcriptional regulator